MNKEQIKKAADEYADGIIDYHNFQVNFNEDNYDAGRVHAIDEFVPKAFEDGAQWRINSVWHDNKMLPKVDKQIIIQVSGKIDIAKRIYENSGLIVINRTVDMTPFGNVTKWAYIEDLFPITIKAKEQ